MANDKSIRVTEEAHKEAVDHVKPKGNLVHWVSEAIIEKIHREKMESPTLHRQFVGEIEHK